MSSIFENAKIDVLLLNNKSVNGKCLQLMPSILFTLGFLFIFTVGRLGRVILANVSIDISIYNTYYVVVQEKIVQNNLFYCIKYFLTYYMLQTILFVYYLLFINIFYFYKLDGTRNNFVAILQDINSYIKSFFSKKEVSFLHMKICLLF